MVTQMIDKPKPESLFAWGTQPRKLYEAMYLCGEVSNAQISRDLHILSYSGVINQIRKKLEPFNINIAVRKYRRGVFAYRLAVRS